MWVHALPSGAQLYFKRVFIYLQPCNYHSMIKQYKKVIERFNKQNELTCAPNGGIKCTNYKTLVALNIAYSNLL